jgi:hypothetical protein
VFKCTQIRTAALNQHGLFNFFLLLLVFEFLFFDLFRILLTRYDLLGSLFAQRLGHTIAASRQLLIVEKRI